MAVDYSVYLVTDPDLVGSNTTFLDRVKEAVELGVTVVQLREKHKNTREFIEVAREVHAVTKPKGIPLIINDRVDVALAIDAEGVHVGQEDLDAATVRKLIGPNKIVGLSVNTVEQAKQAVAENIVDYVGIGAIYGTPTKPEAKAIGLEGLKNILQVLPKHMDSVAIGGVNATNTKEVMAVRAVNGKALGGVAVVSAIMSAPNTKSAVDQLLTEVRKGVDAREELNQKPRFNTFMLSLKKPTFVHHITNNVVKNFSANATIALGGSPAMSECSSEFADFAAIPRSTLLINMGTMTENTEHLLRHAIQAYNAANRPIVFDPVGAGASKYRKELAQRLLTYGKFTVIKGNIGEISALCGGVKGIEMRGVDSIGTVTNETKIKIAKQLSAKTGAIVVISGVEDVIVDSQAKRGKIVKEGHKFLGEITGSGCTLGSAICVALGLKQTLDEVTCAVCAYGVAAKKAGDKVGGPGSFIPAFLDELYKIKQVPFDADEEDIYFED